ncbi:MAG: hypothetical protein WBQ17_03805 [Rhizomicrobium sp.]
MVTLTDDDRRRIAEAVAQSEAQSCGEIACVLAEEASRYREVPLAWAAFAALVLLPIAVALGFRPESLSEIVSNWSAEQAELLHRVVLKALASYAIVQVVIFAIVALLGEVPAVRRAMTPGFVKRHRVRNAARHHFAALAARFGDGASVLIYASRLDRMVEIVTSPAAHGACDPKVWQAAAKSIGDGLSTGHAGDGFVAGIEICGAELAKRFAPGAERRGTPPDALVEE